MLLQNASNDPAANFDDGPRRRSRRVTLRHTAAVRVRGDEYLAKTCDLSEDGVGLLAERCPAEAGDTVEVDVLFGTVLKRFRGVVAFAEAAQAEGALRIGVSFGS